MKVRLRNLIYGLLAFGLPFAVQANEGSEATATIEETLNAPTALNASVGQADFNLGELENVITTQPVHREALRESLRAWADAAEAAQKSRNTGVRNLHINLARS